MRARNLKPKIFKNELLAVADPIYTLIFEGLWCLADRDGRLEDRPALIHFEVNPGRGFEGTERALHWLVEHGFIQRYRVGERAYFQVVKFAKHQTPHHKEPSVFPPPPAFLEAKAQGFGSKESTENPPNGLPTPDSRPSRASEPAISPTASEVRVHRAKAQGSKANTLKQKPRATPGRKGHETVKHEGFAPSESLLLNPESGAIAPTRARATGSDASLTPEQEMARCLGEAGVQVTSSHPMLVAWVQDGFTLETALAATANARTKKPWPDPIPAPYLDKVLRDPHASRNGRNGTGTGKSVDELIDEACER